MLLYLLFSNTAHFALNVLSAFVFSSAGLLYLDSWNIDKRSKTLLVRSFGFFGVALIFAIQAASINSGFVLAATEIGKIAGLLLILFSLIKEPILHPPKLKKAAILAPLPLLAHALTPISAVLLLAISAVYYRKASEGLEKQLRPASVAFLLLGIAELIAVSFTWADTDVVFWSKLLSDFGTIANIQSLFQLAGILVLGFWIWGYIRFRLRIQIFVTTIALSISIFLSTTFFYTFLLLNNLQNDALEHLKTDVNVMQYSLESLKSEVLTHTEAVAQDNVVKQAFINEDQNVLYNLASNYLIEQNASSLIIARSTGEVAIRAENEGATNDSVSGDPLFESALSGHDVSTVSTSDGITAPEVFIKAAVPILDNSKIVGVVMSGIKIDNTFVDSVKEVTGLDTTVFGNDKRTATTLVAEDGKSRSIGTLETDKNILKNVLENGEVYVGTAQIFNQPYYVANAPLTTFDQKTVGMLSVGKPQNTLTKAAQQSINLTFLGSVVLMILSTIPAYFLSQYIQEHMEA